MKREITKLARGVPSCCTAHDRELYRRRGKNARRRHKIKEHRRVRILQRCRDALEAAQVVAIRRRSPRLSEDKAQALADALLGTSGIHDGAFAEEHGVDVGDLEELVEPHEVVKCSECDWWVGISDTEEGEDGEPICDDCRDA